MKKAITILASLLIGTASVKAQKTVWNVDASHSSIGFSIDHMVISETVGEFNEYSMNVNSDKEDFTDASFDVSITVASIDTKSEDRDKHLKGADFFDVAKYPTIRFEGKKFKKVKGNKYKVIGAITMHGVTKKVEFDAKFGGMIKDPWGNTRAGLKIEGELVRKDFNLTYNSLLESGGLALGEEVRIVCNVELVKKK